MVNNSEDTARRQPRVEGGQERRFVDVRPRPVFGRVVEIVKAEYEDHCVELTVLQGQIVDLDIEAAHVAESAVRPASAVRKSFGVTSIAKRKPRSRFKMAGFEPATLQESTKTASSSLSIE